MPGREQWRNRRPSSSDSWKGIQMNRNAMRIGALGTTIVAVGATGIAFAAWTATGTGAGATKASSAADATVTATASPTAAATLWPGNPPAVPVTFSVNNPNPYNVTYKTFNTATISGVTAGSLGTCTAADFDLSSTSGN